MSHPSKATLTRAAIVTGVMVAAMAPLLGDKVRLVIVGDGPARADLDRAVGSLAHPGWVHVLGRRMDVTRLLPAFDVFCLSSRSEGLPLAVPEAMAAGLPVVVTRQPLLPDGAADGIAVGISAPQRWERRRIALRVRRADVAYFDEFPRIDQIEVKMIPDPSTLLANVLAGLGQRVHVLQADSVKGALAELNAHPDTALVLLDLIMPDGDGAGVLERLGVGVDPHDAARGPGEDLGAVALAASQVDDVEPPAALGDPLVDDEVAPEPIVLLGHVGQGALPGQRQRRDTGRLVALEVELRFVVAGHGAGIYGASAAARAFR